MVPKSFSRPKTIFKFKDVNHEYLSVRPVIIKFKHYTKYEVSGVMSKTLQLLLFLPIVRTFIWKIRANDQFGRKTKRFILISILLRPLPLPQKNSSIWVLITYDIRRAYSQKKRKIQAVLQLNPQIYLTNWGLSQCIKHFKQKYYINDYTSPPTLYYTVPSLLTTWNKHRQLKRSKLLRIN